jgi:hypothetical protein
MLGGNKKSKSQMVVKAVREEKVEVELPRPLFRGFIGGDVSASVVELERPLLSVAFFLPLC